MNEKPILFNGEMVRAILRGRKTQTRRVVKPQPALDKMRWNGERWEMHLGYPIGHDVPLSPYGRPGDLLWVRETHRIYQVSKGWRVRYCADDATKDWMMGYMQWHDVANTLQNYKNGSTRPSIFMPRWASRITLRVTDVRVERVQDISEADAVAEGVPTGDDFPLDNSAWCPRCDGYGLHGAVDPAMLGFMEVDCTNCDTPKKLFRNLWDNINAKRGYGWDVNPWVWVVTFEVVQ